MGRTIVVLAVIAVLSGTGVGLVARAARAGGASADARETGEPRAAAVADVAIVQPETAIASPRRAAIVRAELARLRNAARFFIELGELAGAVGATPELRGYGHRLAEEFRAYDGHVIAWAAARDIAAADIVPGDTTAPEPPRHRAERLASLAALKGDVFDRAFWLALARDHATVGDLAATLRWSAVDPGVEDLATALGDELDRSQGGLLSVAALDFPRLAR
jgi:hypothetical protein